MDISTHRTRIHIPIPLLGDSIEESRARELLQRIDLTHDLYMRRKDFPEAERLYKSYVKLHVRWLAEQEEIEHEEVETEVKNVYDERWPMLWGTGGKVEGSRCSSVRSKGVPSRASSSTGISTGRHAPPPSTAPTTHELGDGEPRTSSLSSRIRAKALSEAASDYSAQLGRPRSHSQTECPSTPIFPPLLTNADILCGGTVLRIVSHMPWEAGKLLYCIEWKPHDVDVAPLFWWVKLSGMQFHSALVNEYHHRHSLDPPRWPHKRKLRPSASLGVREIKRALEERKLSLEMHGFAEEETARELADERWRIRDEWQHTGRGWGCAKEIVQRKRKECMEAEHATKSLGGSEGGVDQLLEMAESHSAVQQRSEPVADSQQQPRQRFDAQDELEWREHFGGIIAADPDMDSVASLKRQLLQQGDCTSQPLSRVMSTLRGAKRPPLYAALVGRGGGGGSSLALASNGVPSVNAVNPSNGSGKGIFAGLLGAFSWGLWGRRQKAGTASDEICLVKSLPAVATSPTVGDLDGAPQSESGQQQEQDFPVSSPIDVTTPLEVTRSQTPKQINSLYSFPGYEVCGSRSVTASCFQYKPSPSASTEKFPLRTQTPNQQQQQQLQEHHHHRKHHHHHHHHHSHSHSHSYKQPTKQKSKEPLAGLDVQRELVVWKESLPPPPPPEDHEVDEVVHESELWLDGVGSTYLTSDFTVLMRRKDRRRRRAC